MIRTDVHRPSVINPDDYSYVCALYLAPRNMEDALFSREGRETFQRHMEKTGAKFSNHNHGGTCYCCGAHANFVARFHHSLTNTYIDLGERCADKMDMGEPGAFRRLRKEIDDMRKAVAGKAKAQVILLDNELTECWNIYQEKRPGHEEVIVSDIVKKLIRYGNISENQINFLKRLLEQISKREEIKAKRKEESASAADCPNGRIVIEGIVISTKTHPGPYGTSTIKMIVQHETGYKVWGTLPDSIAIVELKDGSQVSPRGMKVKFTATVTPSDDDPKFGFFKCPKNAEILSKELLKDSSE